MGPDNRTVRLDRRYLVANNSGITLDERSETQVSGQCYFSKGWPSDAIAFRRMRRRFDEITANIRMVTI